MKIFIDSDVLLDFFLNREPFADQSGQLLLLCERRKVHGSTTPLVISNVYYLLRQKTTKEKVMRCMHYLTDSLDIVGMNRESVLLALHSEFGDFEDAMQYGAVSVDRSVQCIVTRNVKDYRKSLLPVQTPSDFLAYAQQHLTSL